MHRTLPMIILFALVCFCDLPQIQADVFVYTDRDEWAAAAATVAGDFPVAFHFHDQNFESVDPGPLTSGLHFLFPLWLDIPGTPGLNSIDDSGMGLSPNGSTYYLADVGVLASEPPVFSFVDLENRVLGFGAEWVLDGDITMDVLGTSIDLNAILPSGAGFIGIVTDELMFEQTLSVHFQGGGLFGIDNISTANVPEPAGGMVSLMAFSGLLFQRRRRRPMAGSTKLT